MVLSGRLSGDLDSYFKLGPRDPLASCLRALSRTTQKAGQSLCHAGAWKLRPAAYRGTIEWRGQNTTLDADCQAITVAASPGPTAARLADTDLCEHGQYNLGLGLSRP